LDRNYLFNLCTSVLVISRTHDGQFPGEAADICSYLTVIIAAITTHPLLHSSEICRFFVHRFVRHGKHYFHDNEVRILRHFSFSKRCLVQYEVCLHFPCCRRRDLFADGYEVLAVRLPTDGL
jgi:hypothetical protein